MGMRHEPELCSWKSEAAKRNLPMSRVIDNAESTG